jgi:hypothetical protein
VKPTFFLIEENVKYFALFQKEKQKAEVQELDQLGAVLLKTPSI